AEPLDSVTTGALGRSGVNRVISAARRRRYKKFLQSHSPVFQVGGDVWESERPEEHQYATWRIGAPAIHAAFDGVILTGLVPQVLEAYGDS
ncbi:hypothetical protein FRC12_023438, partial [Ceratobasidium sp. 428]